MMSTIRRLMLQNRELSDIFSQRMIGKQISDGEGILKIMYREFVETNPELMKKYKLLDADKKPPHIYEETATTKTIEAAIRIFGWRGYIEGFIKHARNKEDTLKTMGLTKEAEAWDKIARCLGAMPKYPQG